MTDVLLIAIPVLLLAANFGGSVVTSIMSRVSTPNQPAAWPSDKGPTPDASAYIAAMRVVGAPDTEFAAAVVEGKTPFEHAIASRKGAK